MKNNIHLFISIYIILILIQSCKNYYYVPKDLSKLNFLYRSPFRVSHDQAIITYDYVYFIAEKAKGFNWKKLGLWSSANVFGLYGNTFRKPLLYISTPISFFSIFFTKDCYIYIYIDSGEDTCYRQKYQLYFENMGRCYDSLRIYYDTKTKDAAVYNYYQSNQIAVFNLRELSKGNFKIFLEIENKADVLQTLIYPYGDGNSILIIIDIIGIRFHNLRGEHSWFWDFWKDGRLIKEYNFYYSGMADFIDDGNKLLYIYYNHFFVFELKDFEIIYDKYNFIIGEGVNCLLGLKDGNALVGTDKGNIYLIEYKNEKLTILDERNVCDQTVISLSYNNNCVKETKSCYIFVANCGYLRIFEI